MSTSPLGEATRLWLLWKRTHEHLKAEVVSLTTVPTDISDPELSVLVTLYQAGRPRRQSDLARELRWDRTRLSHLLTRMTKKSYVRRLREADGVAVELLPAGVALIETAAPDLESAVQQHLVDRLGSADARMLRTLLERLDRRE